MSDTTTKTKMNNGVVKRGKTWSYVIRVVDPETGKRKPKWVGGFKTQREAKSARAAATRDTDRGTYVERKATTLGEWLTEWVEAHAATVRPATAESYRLLIRRYVRPYSIYHANLQQLTPSDLSKHWRTIHESGGDGGKALSVRTVRYAHTVVSKALKDAVTDRKLEINPAIGVKLPKKQGATSRIPDAWSPENLRTFLESTSDDPRMYALWVLLAYTGMRRGEALALRWEDIDVDGGDVRIWRSVSDTGSGRTYHDPKNGQERTVTVAQPARDALRAWRKAQAAERLAAGPAYADTDGLVFTQASGRPLAPEQATKGFGSAVKGADVPRITLHGLRHTAATLLLGNGAPLAAVSAMLGHKDSSVTMNVYWHVMPKDGTELASQLERIVSGNG